MRLPLAAVLLIAVAPGACDAPPTHVLNGYGEAEYLYISPQDAGVLARLAVKEGDRVGAGDVLFSIDPARLQASAQSAEASAAAAAKRAEKGGALDAAVAEAEAQLVLMKKNLARSSELVKTSAVAQARYDADKTAVEQAQAALERARAERAAGQAERDAANAQARLAGIRASDLDVRAPTAGSIERVYRRTGEMVSPGQPVVALLAPENMKIRFFVPEPLLAKFSVGEEISYGCDGCATGLKAHVSFIATEPQFTPPVIYSLEERDKLMFMAEARPDAPGAVRPGLPVDVAIPQ